MTYTQQKHYQKPFEKPLSVVFMLLKKCTSKYAVALSQSKKITLIYTIIQTLLPFSKMQPHVSFEQFFSTVGISFAEYAAFFLANESTVLLQMSPKTWNQFLMINFIILDAIITKRTNKTFRFDGKGGDTSSQKPVLENPLKTRFAPFLIIGLNDVRSSIRGISKDIVDHKFTLLFTVFARNVFDPKAGLRKEILTSSLSMPFDDNQIAKAHCAIELYRSGDYLRAFQLVQQFLERERPGDRMFLAIIALASIICGKCLDRLEVTC